MKTNSSSFEKAMFLLLSSEPSGVDTLRVYLSLRHELAREHVHYLCDQVLDNMVEQTHSGLVNETQQSEIAFDFLVNEVERVSGFGVAEKTLLASFISKLTKVMTFGLSTYFGLPNEAQYLQALERHFSYLRRLAELQLSLCSLNTYPTLAYSALYERAFSVSNKIKDLLEDQDMQGSTRARNLFAMSAHTSCVVALTPHFDRIGSTGSVADRANLVVGIYSTFLVETLSAFENLSALGSTRAVNLLKDVSDFGTTASFNNKSSCFHYTPTSLFGRLQNPLRGYLTHSERLIPYTHAPIRTTRLSMRFVSELHRFLSHLDSTQIAKRTHGLESTQDVKTLADAFSLRERLIDNMPLVKSAVSPSGGSATTLLLATETELVYAALLDAFLEEPIPLALDNRSVEESLLSDMSKVRYNKATGQLSVVL